MTVVTLLTLGKVRRLIPLELRYVILLRTVMEFLAQCGWRPVLVQAKNLPRNHRGRLHTGGLVPQVIAEHLQLPQLLQPHLLTAIRMENLLDQWKIGIIQLLIAQLLAQMVWFVIMDLLIDAFNLIT